MTADFISPGATWEGLDTKKWFEPEIEVSEGDYVDIENILGPPGLAE